MRTEPSVVAFLPARTKLHQCDVAAAGPAWAVGVVPAPPRPAAAAARTATSSTRTRTERSLGVRMGASDGVARSLPERNVLPHSAPGRGRLRQRARTRSGACARQAAAARRGGLVAVAPLDRPERAGETERAAAAGLRRRIAAAEVRRSRLSSSALTATRMLEPDIAMAAISGRSVRPSGAKTPAAIGQGDGVVADRPAEVLAHLAQGAASDGDGARARRPGRSA